MDSHALQHAVDASKISGWFATVIFLGVTAGVQMSDRGLQAILSPAIRETFGVGDAVIGALHGIAGILAASALAVPLARLADRHSRKMILLGLIATWTLLTALGALAPNFPTFFIGRAASGVTEFAMIPIVYSLIPDLVSEQKRVSANLLFAALMATGASLGFYLGGNLLDLATGIDTGGQIEPWRVAMLILSCGGIPLLIAGLFTVDPPRTAIDVAEERSGSLARFAQTHARRILLFVASSGGLAIAVQATTPMIAMALSRRFDSDLNGIGHALGIITLVSSLGSLPMAGVLDRMLRPRLRDGARPAVMAAASALSLPGAALLGFAAHQDAALAMVAAFLLLTCIANALIPTMLQDLAPASLRARCFAVYSFMIAAFCAVGPVLSGLVSDRITGGDLLLAIAIVAVPALLFTIVAATLSAKAPRFS